MFRRIILTLCLLLLSDFTYAQTTYDLSEHMKYLAERERILSQNIANVDTPGYKPKDLTKNHGKEGGFKMSITSQGHIQNSETSHYEVIPGEILEIKPNGNAVTAEHELMKKNENAIKFSEINSLYNKSKQMMKTAIGNK